uniref:ER membrane protein complex subunit 1 n=1 Tax=Panagrolaimus sp. ES5 TaxID=591445 RepID=A0AC34GTR0_9BILA
MKLIYIFLIALAISGVKGLYEDQVGKFDWRARHIGCPNKIQLGQTKSGNDYLIVSSKRNALASINVNSGDIEWRQINEIDAEKYPIFVTHEATEKTQAYVATLINNGEHIRVFNQETGVLKWQHRTNLQAKKFNRLLLTEKLVVLLSDSTVTGFSASRGLQRFTTTLPIDSLIFLDAVKNDDNSAIIVSVSGNTIKLFTLDFTAGAASGLSQVSLKSVAKKCILSGNALACMDAAGSISVIDVTLKSSIVSELSSGNSDIYSLPISGYVVVLSSSNLVVYKLESQKPVEILKTLFSRIFDGALNVESQTYIFAVYLDLQRTIKFYDLSNGKELFSRTLEPHQQAPIQRVALLPTQELIQMVTLRKDCRMDLYEINLNEEKVNLEWSRFEGLATISSVEMVNLPLSESQTRIETEFSVKDASFIKAFFVRITTQIEEIRRSILGFVDRFIASGDLLKRSDVSLTIIVKNLFGDDTALRQMQKPRPGSPSVSDLVLERDYFNLRKVIVVSTLSGSLYGINNEDGSVIWSLYLGDDVVPLKSQLGNNKMPLFIQRGTAYYQYPSQAVVAFGLKHSQRARLVVFNPVTGELINTFDRDGIKRIEILPFANSEMLHPLLTVDSKNKIEVFPTFNDTTFPHPISIFSFDINAGKIWGDSLDLNTLKSTPLWKAKLNFSPNEKFVYVAGKPSNQKTHSQGKVLGDRAVLYKYVNPNLVSALSYDSETSILSIYMIDAFTGQILHTARHSKVRPPFHSVHCENYLVYTLWNSVHRRTELGVIELYEGLEQTNAERFNSLSTTKAPLEVISKSFIFSQGVSAIHASDTEQGLSTRSVIIAMPFGGILEISRRFVDARRPLEMTADLREEMIVPYIPELPVATEELINYNQTVSHIHGIKTAPSGLESTSLMLAYGMDLFYTRVTPSGTFDILRDDFDWEFISIVMILLIVMSYVVKRYWRITAIRQAWS